MTRHCKGRRFRRCIGNVVEGVIDEEELDNK
jgi:hypothetical protein